MSRSRQRTPIGGIAAARSEKHDKRLANRKARRQVRVAGAAKLRPPRSQAPPSKRRQPTRKGAARG